MRGKSISRTVAINSIIAAFFIAGSVRATPIVWINELHYDNASTDSGEFVEVAGQAGTDLTGWSIALYNGAGGAVYDTVNLSGTLPDLSNGYGALGFLRAGIQNGPPDGLALVDSASSVVQFLSYEGSFTAVGGPADGLTSSDIGVAETSSTPVGYSLQLMGSGTSYSDFAWAAPGPATSGAINTGQSFPVQDGAGSSSVPDGGATIALLGLSFAGFGLLHRHRKQA